MFDKLKNLFGGNNNKYFFTNPNTDELPTEQQFAISLGQIIGEHNNYFIDSLEATKDKKMCKDIMKKWWGITDKLTAHEILASRSKDGHRFLYNELVDLFIECDGNTANLDKNDPNYEYIVEYFDNVNEVLQMDEGKLWFPDFRKDFLIKCDAWDIGRMVFVSRTCYTIAYITEDEAWQYINYVKDLARKSFTNWHDYAKSYLLGRALWGGNNYDDFDVFSDVTEFLLEDEDSPWVEHDWLS